jgi:hypothetical protein
LVPQIEKVSYHQGSLVEAKYHGGSVWYKATVIKANDDGSFDLRFDDGEVELYVRPNNIRKQRTGEMTDV